MGESGGRNWEDQEELEDQEPEEEL